MLILIEFYLCKVNLFSKVPLIISNCELSLGDYNVEEGNMFDENGIVEDFDDMLNFDDFGSDEE